MVPSSSKDRTCRIAVASCGGRLDSKIGPLARCTHFVIFEGSPENFKVVECRSKGAANEKGPSAAENIAGMGVGTVITGTIGPRAYKILRDAGISVKAGCSGTVAEAVKKCAAGKLKECMGATYAGRIDF
jgi:predicted Fe-Mo cluster-binding NifX family protein